MYPYPIRVGVERVGVECCNFIPRVYPCSSLIAQNALQMFCIDCQKPNDLKPAYICHLVRELSHHRLVVQGDDQLSQEA